MEGERRETWGEDETGVLERSRPRRLGPVTVHRPPPPAVQALTPWGSERLLWAGHSAHSPATRACSAGSPGGLGGREGGFARST